MRNLDCMIDIHLHLDGAISVESAKELANLQGIKIPDSDEEIRKLLQVSDDCKDLNEFLEKFEFPCSLLMTEEGMRRATSNLLNELKSQGVMYAELRFAPQLSTANGLKQSEVVKAAIKGVADVSGIQAKLILCCMRGTDLFDANIETIDVASELMPDCVCAVDLAGAEGLFPTKDFEDIFAYARKKGVPFVIHAGEADGPESVWKALEFGAVRIGHGVRAVEDEKLLNELAKRQIPLEVCPTSNVKICICDSIKTHPVKRLMDAGCMVTINTDDPSVEGTDINKEYELIKEAFKLSDEDIKKLLINGVKASFANETDKQKMLERIENEMK